jgi:uncharacterized membrane protein YgaE (UPF0421/DUF939 family)
VDGPSVVRAALRRVRGAALPIVQSGLAAGLAWLVATDVIGHRTPFFAPIAAVVSLGVSLGQRLRRAVELVAGVSVGVGVGDVLISRIGTGAWQLTLIVVLALTVATLLDGGGVIAMQSASSAVLVATLSPAGGATRAIDALVGGAVGLAVAALLPADPVRAARLAADRLLAELAGTLSDVADAVRTADVAACAAALSRARAMQPRTDGLRTAVRVGEEITAMAPLRRGRRARLDRFAAIATPLDHAVRNVRVLARRALAALRGHEPVDDVLPRVLDELAGAVRLLRTELLAGSVPRRARAALLTVGGSLGAALAGESGFSGRVVVAQLRSTVVDLLLACGVSRQDGLAALPPPPTG